MNIREFADVWRKEAKILKEYLKSELEKAAERKETALIFNYESYSTYAILSCIMWLHEEGYQLVDTNIEKVFEIRW